MQAQNVETWLSLVIFNSRPSPSLAHTTVQVWPLTLAMLWPSYSLDLCAGKWWLAGHFHTHTHTHTHTHWPLSHSGFRIFFWIQSSWRTSSWCADSVHIVNTSPLPAQNTHFISCPWSGPHPANYCPHTQTQTLHRAVSQFTSAVTAVWFDNEQGRSSPHASVLWESVCRRGRRFLFCFVLILIPLVFKPGGGWMITAITALCVSLQLLLLLLLAWGLVWRWQDGNNW